MIGVRKYNPSLIHGSFIINDKNKKKTIHTNEADKAIIFSFIINPLVFYI